MANTILQISRTDALLKLGFDPKEKIRNYELEERLWKRTGEKWVINEFCPFNGYYCDWVQHCELSELTSLVNLHKGRGFAEGLQHDLIAAYLEKEVEKRNSTVQLEGGENGKAA